MPKLKSRFIDLLNAVFDNVHGRFDDHFFKDIGGQYIFCTKSKRKKQMTTHEIILLCADTMQNTCLTSTVPNAYVSMTLSLCA